MLLKGPKFNLHHLRESMIPIQNAMAVNSKIGPKVLGRVGYIAIYFFEKKASSPDHTFTCFWLCCLCSDLCFAFLFYSQPGNSIVTSSRFKSQDFSQFVQLVINLCFDWTLILQSLPIFSLKEFSQKARKRMNIRIVTNTELCLPHHEHHHIGY